MVRIAFLLIIAVAAALASWQAAGDPGIVVIEWGGYRIDTTALFGLLTILLIVAVALPLLRMIMFLMDAPGRIGKASERSRRRKGNEALALGLIAAEAGEFDEARKHADRAEDLIDEPRLANLLQARSAEVAGDFAAAERAYSGMLQNEDTELLGRKGLLTAALKRGDRTAAMTHAEAALRVSKTAAWPFQTLFELKVAAAEWEGAIDALEQGEKRKLVEDKVARRRRAVLLTAAALKAERERRPDKAADMRPPPRSPRGCWWPKARTSAPPRSSKKRGKTRRIRRSRTRIAISSPVRAAISARSAWPASSNGAAIIAKAASCSPNWPWSAAIGVRRRPRWKTRTANCPPRASARCSPPIAAAKATRTARAHG
jgi:tetratricopeptide (TPR) repeat protein